jgi:hypothetical protein
MKKFNSFLLIAILSVLALNINAATVWQVSAGADLYTTYNNAGFVSGDIIELTTDGGAYTWGTKLGAVTKSFTIKAAAGLIAKPVVTLATPATAGAFFQVNNSTNYVISITLDGVEIAGNANITAFIIAGKTMTGGDIIVTVNNCKFTGFTNSATGNAYFSYSNSYNTTTDIINKNFGDLTVTNSAFIGGYSVYSCGAVGSGNGAANHFNTANNIKFINCYFKSITNNCINQNTTTIKANSVEINHCTFDGCATVALYKELSIGSTETTGGSTVVKNTLFANRGASVANNLYGAIGAVANVNNAVYYTGTGTLDAIYPIATLSDYVTAGFNIDPVIGSNYVATASVYNNAGSDGKTIGYVGPNGIPTAIKNQTQTASKALSVIQNGTSFTINSPNAPFAVYATSGSQVANGQLVNGTMNLNLNKGIYILKSNGQVAKFAVR